MILLDLLNKGRYKGKSFEWSLLQGESVSCIQRVPAFRVVGVPVSASDQRKYEAMKEQLFADLGQGDPDTIPRQLHILAGNLKKQRIEPDRQYVARNDRFKLLNVTTYDEVNPGEYTVIDFPHRRINFNDFLKTTGMNLVEFLSTNLKVDQYYANEFQAWTERVSEFYAQASVYQ